MHALRAGVRSVRQSLVMWCIIPLLLIVPKLYNVKSLYYHLFSVFVFYDPGFLTWQIKLSGFLHWQLFIQSFRKEECHL